MSRLLPTIEPRLIGALFSCILMFTMPAPAAPCDSLLDAGETAYQSFDNESALQYFSAAHRECPRRYEALYKKVRALIDHGEDIDGKKGMRLIRQGFEATDTLLTRYPDSLQTHFLRAAAAGLLAREAGGGEKVRLAQIVHKEARMSIAIDSSYAPAYVVLGGYYYGVARAGRTLKSLAWLFGGVPDGTLEDAREALEKALRLDPGNIYAHYELARTCLALDKKQCAKEHLRAVERLPPTQHTDAATKEKTRVLLKNMH